MSMRNFLRNPKIALRKPTEHPKYSKNQKIILFPANPHMKAVPEIIYRWGGSGFKLHRALTDHPTDILATKPAGKYGYGMGSKFLGRFRPSNTSLILVMSNRSGPIPEKLDKNQTIHDFREFSTSISRRLWGLG